MTPLHDVGGTLYGTTFVGGAYYGGTVYTISASGTVTVVHSFGGPGDGANPYAPVISVAGTLYGTLLRRSQQLWHGLHYIERHGKRALQLRRIKSDCGPPRYSPNALRNDLGRGQF